MSSDLGISNALTGQLITVYAVSFAVFGPILVKATEKLRPKPVILVSLIVFILGNIIFGLSSTFMMLALGRVITALAAAVFIVKIMDMTVLLSEPAIRGRMIALVYMGFSAANVFGIPIGTIIGQQFGWRIIFWLVIVIAVIVGLGIIALAPNKRGEDLGDPVPDKILDRRNIVLYIGVTMSVLIGNYIVLGYISPLMTTNGYSIENVSIALLIAGVGGMLGTILGGNLVDRIGHTPHLDDHAVAVHHIDGGDAADIWHSGAVLYQPVPLEPLPVEYKPGCAKRPGRECTGFCSCGLQLEHVRPQPRHRHRGRHRRHLHQPVRHRICTMAQCIHHCNGTCMCDIRQRSGADIIISQ